VSAIIELFGPTITIFKYIFRFWWIWFGPLSFLLFRGIWLTWRQQIFKSKTEWVLLEMKFPREILKSPKAMDQFFSALCATRNSAGDFLEKYFDGEVTQWFNFEMISVGGDIRFLIRAPRQHLPVIRSNLYANYPSIELEEVTDYMLKLPHTLDEMRSRGQEMYGTEFVFGNNDAYPIRTYLAFEGVDEEKSVDTIGAMLEVLRSIDRKEQYYIHFLLRPSDPEWKKQSEALVEELKKKDVKIRVSQFGEYEDKPIRTPGETEVMKQIEEKSSKSGFDTIIRFLYISDASAYKFSEAKRSVLSALNQHSRLDLNYFFHNLKVQTLTKWIHFPYFFPKHRMDGRKRRFLYNFRHRKMPEENVLTKYLFLNAFNFNLRQKTIVLNTEELATLIHPPTILLLTSPLIKQVPSKKMAPPLGAKIFIDDEK
jgi:hypothetical protein